MTDKLDRGRLEISADECKGCGLCIVACPVQVIEFSKTVINKQDTSPRPVQGSGCTGCGTCFYACPEPGR